MKINLQQKKSFSEQNMRKIINLIIGLQSSVNEASAQCLRNYIDDGSRTYSKNEICIHDGYIWEALTVTQGAWDESKWTKIGTDDITELDLDTIKSYLNLSQQDLDNLQNLIDDAQITLTKTHSSSKIYMDIQQCLDDSKTFTLKEISKLSGASYKVVTSTSEMTSESIIYLLPNATNYDMYIVEENGTATKIGNMDVDLSQYLTKTEIEADYLKKTDADGKYATITTVDGKVDKTNISTTIDSSSTDDKIPSAKAIYDKYSFHDLSEANTNVLDNALLVDPHNQNGANNKDCLVTSSSSQAPGNLLWGIRQVFWHADSDLVLKITGKDINNKGCIWINSLMLKDGRYHWLGWSRDVTNSGSEVIISKLLTIKQANACTFSGETITSNSGDSGGGCVFTAPLGAKTVAFDLISDGIFCQCGLCNMSGTLPTIITTGAERDTFKNVTTSGTYYIENIKVGSNIYIGGRNGVQISNIRITEWY